MYRRINCEFPRTDPSQWCMQLQNHLTKRPSQTCPHQSLICLSLSPQEERPRLIKLWHSSGRRAKRTTQHDVCSTGWSSEVTTCNQSSLHIVRLLDMQVAVI